MNHFSIKSSHDSLPVTREMPERPRDPAAVAARELRRDLERLANKVQPKNLPRYKDRVLTPREIALKGNEKLRHLMQAFPPEFPALEPALHFVTPTDLARRVIAPPATVAARPVDERNPIDVAVDKAIAALAARDAARDAAKYGDIASDALAPF